MGTLSQETQLVQNPALGAMLLWRFVSGYERQSKVHNHTPLPLLFLVLPVTLHQDTAQFIASTRVASGLRAFVTKFSDSSVSKSDVVLAINDRAIKLRKLSIDSLKLAVAASLLAIDSSHALVISLSSTPPRSRVPRSVRVMLQSAEKFGQWCSEVSLHEVSLILKVRF
jgi:hypothetical protein